MIAYNPNDIKPGWVAFFVVMALVVATFLLWRSMNTQLGKIQVPPRASFGPDAADRPTGSEPDDERPSSPSSDDDER